MAANPKIIMTVEQVAEYLDVHKSTVYKMLKKKEIPAFRVGSDWRFTRDTLDEWIAKQQKESLGGA